MAHQRCEAHQAVKPSIQDGTDASTWPAASSVGHKPLLHCQQSAIGIQPRAAYHRREVQKSAPKEAKDSQLVAEGSP
jgi:hypothetical protein